MNKYLFILKKRLKGEYGSWNYSDGEPLDSGLLVSARQIVRMLHASDIEAELVQVIDNNDIDREVAKYRPTHVIIEAFWVIPEKFTVLSKLHPNVVWIVRNHSKVDFLAHEGSAFGWLLDYIKMGVYVASNSIDATEDITELVRIFGLDTRYSIYLPNYYDLRDSKNNYLEDIVDSWKAGIQLPVTKQEGIFNVGCFGAIRPLKNHVVQALAAINVADYLGLKLNFHISATRIEGKATSMLNALRSIFARSEVHSLVEHEWKPHKEFVEIISTMDVNLQISISETFNIVCADSVSTGVPVLVSNQVPWLGPEYQVANPINVQEISTELILLWNASASKILVSDQYLQLVKYCEDAKDVWLDFSESY